MASAPLKAFLTLEDVFDRVSKLVRETPESSELATTQEVKLRLYGLYKHVTCGPCPNTTSSSSATSGQQQPPSIFQPVARAKYQAWQACQDFTKQEAMSQYIDLVTSQNHWLGETCREWMQEYENDTASPDKETHPKVTDTNPKPTDGSLPEANHDSASNANATTDLTNDEATQVQSNDNKDPPSAINNNDGKYFTLHSQQRCKSWCEKWFGIIPVIPRGRLDISVWDLLYVTAHCFWCFFQSSTTFRYYQLDQRIKKLVVTACSADDQQQKVQNKHEVRVVVGLSVRSLLDLYLLARKYPRQSEIIMVPPINIPGMVQVLEHHELQVVSVDLPGDKEMVSISVDVDAVEKAITERTVAILVVHPFGMISASDETMKRLDKLARQHKLDVLEDCAECFTGFVGPDAYLGSPYSKVSFFSFGLIKTCTALGGGIALVREPAIDPSDLSTTASSTAIKMDRTQSSLYPQATLREYAWKIVLAVCICVATSHPLLYGLVVALCKRLGLDFDAIAVRMTRSFVAAVGGTKNIQSQREFIYKFRKRPCNTLMYLLYRRLRSPAQSVAKRIAQCRRMTQQLTKFQVNGLVLPCTCDSGKNTWWLYPIRITDPSSPDEVCRSLRCNGADATRGMSQLCCVMKASPLVRGSSPQALQFMEEVIYLPVGMLSDYDFSYLVQTLQHVMAYVATPQHGRNGSVVRNQSSIQERGYAIPALALTLFDVLLLRGKMFFTLLLRVVPLIVSWSIVLFLAAILFTHVLRWCIADFYIETSKAFAKYNSLLHDPPAMNAGKASSVEANQHGDVTQETVPDSILSKIKAIQLVKGNQLTSDSSSRALITGATGFIGSLLLRDILRLRKTVGFSAGVVVLCRSKRGKSASERISELLSGDMFSFLSDEEKVILVVTVESDVTKPRAGLTDANWDYVCRLASISHIFHCAASVSFTLTLLDSAKANISSALTMQALASQVNGRAKFIHISTAFVHGGNAGSKLCPLPEQLFSLDPYSPTKIYESMLGTQFYASKAMVDLGFPNTYVFSKCVCEHLLTQASDVTTIIIRPSIVGPAIENPHEGWAGDRPQTIVAAAALYLSYQWNLWCFGSHAVPYIPVDVVTMVILSKTTYLAAQVEQVTSSDFETLSSEDGFEKVSSEASSLSGDCDCEHRKFETAPHPNDDKITLIINATWSVSSPPSSSFTWLQYAVTVTQLGSVLGYFSKSSAYLGLFFTSKIQPKLFMTQDQYEKLHYFLVQLPLSLALFALETIGWSTSRVRILTKFIDLPILFSPFMSRAFFFESSIVAPTELCGDRYNLMCAVVAERFLKVQNNKTQGQSSRRKPLTPVQAGVGMVIGGQAHQPLVSDFWTVLTEPRGSYCMRLAAWAFAKLLRSTCFEVMVDVSSFSAVVVALSGQDTHSPVHVVLAPTHRSLFDSLLLSFTFFCIPEMQIKIPLIVAADDFSRIPLIGWLARSLNAVFIQRGKGSVDPSLRNTVSDMKLSSRKIGGGACIEVFIEGTRSRDRRFVGPRTGFLKCLEETEGSHLLVPITINYERIPEQAIFAAEVAGGTRRQLDVGGLLVWLLEVAKGNIQLGRIFIAAGKTVVMNETSNCVTSHLTNLLQREQQALIHASSYHINAAAIVLKMEAQKVRISLNKLGCPEWPQSASSCEAMKTDTKEIELPDDLCELFTIMLQFGHLLCPLVKSSHPLWSSWLNRVDSDKAVQVNDDPALREIADALCNLFENADLAINRAQETLVAKGFHQTGSSHLLQEARKNDSSVPLALLVAAVDQCRRDSPDSHGGEVCDIAPIGFDGIVSGSTLGDKLGYWGYSDSMFSVQVNRAGQSYVVMSGSRYNICGKQLTKLIPFIETETQVNVEPRQELAFVRQHECKFPPPQLNSHDIECLMSSGIKFSLSTRDRAQSGSGQSQEDVFLLRNNRYFRIPDAVAWPTLETEIVELVTIAKSRGWNLIPFGGGTNVTSATRCPPQDFDPRPVVSVCMQMMSRVLWVNEEDGVAHVEAGITGQALSEYLHRLGYTVGHEPDSIEFSTLGGWIATKASGMKKNKYGNIEDIVKSVRVVTSGGVTWQGYDNTCPSTTVVGRESRGLDLCNIMLGSEGCFGIISSAVIRISTLPETKDFECILFTDFESGLRFVRDVAKLGRNIPASLRLFDNAHVRLGQALRPAPSLFQIIAKWAYFQSSKCLEEASCVSATVAYEGSRDEVQMQKRVIYCLTSKHGGIRLGSRAGSEGYDLTFVIAYLRDFAVSHDMLAESFETFAPWSKIIEIMNNTKKCIENEHRNRSLPGKPFIGCRLTQVYHEGACLYFYLCMNVANVENPSSTFADMERLARAQILKSGGSLTHHHGVGKLRASFCKSLDPDCFKTIIKTFKESVDKENIFGAGNGLFSYHKHE